MGDFCVSKPLGAPSWLKAHFDELFQDQWTSIAKACLTLIELSLQSKIPDRVELHFDVMFEKLRIYIETFPPLPHKETQALYAITNYFTSIANNELEALAEVGEGSVAKRFCRAISNTHKKTKSTQNSVVKADEKKQGLFFPAVNVIHEIDVQRDQNGHRLVEVFSGLSDESCESASAARDGDTTKRLMSTLKKLRSSGHMRPLKHPGQDWRYRLDSLELESPNFQSVIQTVIRPHLELLCQGRMHRMAPILLVGKPGVGKTHFARQLQSILGVPLLFLVMAAETNGSSLGGSSTFYGNSSPGRLFEQMAWGNSDEPAANPLVVLDEVDKVKTGYYDPMASLYSLLEAETARRFEDQSVPNVFLNLTNVRFILTANIEDDIPEPIRSRAITFHIQLPDERGTKAIAQRMFESLLKKNQLDLNSELPAVVMAEISGLGPRESKIRLEAAAAIAFSKGLKELDLVSWRQTDCGGQLEAKRMGFL